MTPYPTEEYTTYLEKHRASGIKVGDKVRVLRKAVFHECGWDNAWLPSMNSSIETVHTVTADKNEWGFSLDSGFCYPYFVLEKISEGEKIMKYNYLKIKPKDETNELLRNRLTILTKDSTPGDVTRLIALPYLGIRNAGEFKDHAIYLDCGFDWVLGKDSENAVILVPLKKNVS